MLPRLLSEQTRRQWPEVIARIEAMIRTASPAGAAAALRGMAARPDVRDRLASIHVPALIIVGQEDVISPPAEMRQIAEVMSGQYVEIAAAGHMTPMETPDAFGDALIPFLV
jgi:pimeloyl-ACP methyl ester carboxylesterase